MRPRRALLGTRASALARRQAGLVSEQLQTIHADLEIEVRIIAASADLQPDKPLSAIGGEGVFVKELETALIKGEIDFAVHSLKDLPLAIPNALCIAAVLERDEPRDAIVIRGNLSFDQLPVRARVGTSSLRRKAQLLHHRGDLDIVELRGNVDTRLRKLDEGCYDAIVIAACGLKRLGLENRISDLLDMAWMLPEPGQGALAIEARKTDAATLALLAGLNHPQTQACVAAERAFLAGLGGGCAVPIAAFASESDGKMVLQGAVIAAGGHEQLRGVIEGPLKNGEALGKQLAAQLVAQGAKRLLAGI